jgi:TatD DNase family protein
LSHPTSSDPAFAEMDASISSTGSFFVDTHAHLDVEDFDADRAEVMARARQAGVTAVICPGITADSSQSAVRLAESVDGVFAAVGIQPNYCGQAAAGDWDRVVALAVRGGVWAIGETGLDRHWDFTPLAVQQDYFDRHLRLAQARGLPVIVHCREAEADVLAMLREAAGRPPEDGRRPLAGVFHAFSGDCSFAEECLALGFSISLAGPVTYTNKKFATLRNAARAIPDDRLLVETDSPYLVPHPLRGRQKRNEPANVALVAECVAGLRGVSVAQLAAQTTANARRLFRLP